MAQPRAVVDADGLRNTPGLVSVVYNDHYGAEQAAPAPAPLLCLFCQQPNSKPVSPESSVQTIKMEALCSVARNVSVGEIKGATCVGAARRQAFSSQPPRRWRRAAGAPGLFKF